MPGKPAPSAPPTLKPTDKVETNFSVVKKDNAPSAEAKPWQPTDPLGKATNQDIKSAPSEAVSNVGSVSAVKQMQQLLISIAYSISNHQIHDTPHRPTDKDSLAGADPFMSFLVNNYVNKSKPVGNQVVNTDVHMPSRMETSKLNDNLKGILTTIQRIGTPGAEQKPDGQWGPRTTNALKQTYALAYMMMQLKKDMGIAVEGYSDADLTKFHGDIPDSETKLPAAEQNQRATALIQDLTKFKQMYEDFRESILNNPNHAQYITQDKPLMLERGNQQNPTALHPDDQELYKQVKGIQVNTTVNGKALAITPYDLETMDNFKKFLDRNNNIEAFALSPEEQAAFSKNDKNILNKLVSQVHQGLETLQETR